MKRLIEGGLVALTATISVIAMVAAVSVRSKPALAAAPEPVGKATAAVPVVVELFTSEGCSSCPPADDVLEKLGRTQPVAGAHIITLGEHVDYWDRAAWRDRFSSPAFTRRQNEYANTFKNSQVYTPQMVVDGQAEFVGSDQAKANATISHAAHGRTKATVSIVATKTTSGIALQVMVAPGAVKGADVYAALAEDGLSSAVKGGENAGRRLAHAAVVRSLVRVGTTDANGAFNGTVSVPLASGWQRDHLRAVAFVQEGGGRIRGAVETPSGL